MSFENTIATALRHACRAKFNLQYQLFFFFLFFFFFLEESFTELVLCMFCYPFE